MTCDIFYRSYAKDFPWLAQSLLSQKKYASGFHKTHIAVPVGDLPQTPEGSFEIHLVNEQCNGYLAQQITKLHADDFCKSDYILHVDSDCIWDKPVNPECFLVDGKPVMLREDGCESPWMAISAISLGWLDDYEYMRRLPIIYPRWIYGEFRAWMNEAHHMSVDQWIMQQPNNSFSEFNTLGQWAFKYHKDAFTWLHPYKMASYCKQYWSWGGIESHIDEIKSTIAA